MALNNRANYNLQPPNLLSTPAEALSIEWKLIYPIQTTCYLLKQVTSIQWRGLLCKACQVFKFYHISTIHKLTVLESLVGQKCNLSNELNSAHFYLNRWEIWLRYYHLIHQGGNQSQTRPIASHSTQLHPLHSIWKYLDMLLLITSIWTGDVYSDKKSYLKSHNRKTNNIKTKVKSLLLVQ